MPNSGKDMSKSQHGLEPAKQTNNNKKPLLFGASRRIAPSDTCFCTGAAAGAVLRASQRCDAASAGTTSCRAWQGEALVVLTNLLLLIFTSKRFSSQFRRCLSLPPAMSAASPRHFTNTPLAWILACVGNGEEGAGILGIILGHISLLGLGGALWF